MGTMFITNNSTVVDYTEEFTQSAEIGIELIVVPASAASSTVEFYMTAGNIATMKYSIVRMD